MAGSPGAPQKLPLHYAAMGGREFELACLLAEGSDVNAIDGWGLTPLHSAATSGQAACIDRLVAAGADLEARASVGTPLHAAAENGQVEAIRALLAAGADLEASAKDGLTLEDTTPLFAAVAAGQVAAARELITAGASLEVCFPWTPLHQAANRGSLEMVRLLLEAGADVNARDATAQTPLAYAATGHQSDVAEVLIAAGADPVASTFDGVSLLHQAAGTGAVGVLKQLLAAGADVHAVTCGGCTALHSAANYGEAEAVEALLVAGAPLEARCKEGLTALHSAAGFGAVTVIHPLLKAGAELEARTAMGVAPLHFAAAAGDVPALQALLVAGADAHVQCGSGYSALHWAADNLQLDAVAALVGAGLDINAYSSGTSCHHLFLHAVAKSQVPAAPQQLRRLLSMGASVARASDAVGTAVDSLFPTDNSQETGVLDPQSYVPELVRILAAEGCPILLDIPSMVRPDYGKVRATAASWLAQLCAEAELPAPGSSALEVSRALVECSGKAGSLLGEAGQEFGRALGAFEPPPTKGVWQRQHQDLALHFCHLVAFLRAAGCAPVQAGIEGLSECSGTSPGLEKNPPTVIHLPSWAKGPLSFLPLLLAGQEWSPVVHINAPGAFRQAAKALLLINHCRGFGAPPQPPAAAARRGLLQRLQKVLPRKVLLKRNRRRAQRAQHASSVQLPTDVLLYILQLATQPFPEWVPQLRPRIEGSHCLGEF